MNESYSGLPATNSPRRVEPPPHLVGVQAVPNMISGMDGSLADSGKVEVRITKPFTRGKDKKVDWQRTAYLAAHEALYAYQSARDQDIRLEELERNASDAIRDWEKERAERILYQRECDSLHERLEALYSLRERWYWRLLPARIRVALFPLEAVQ